jgi:esterase/lipase
MRKVIFSIVLLVIIASFSGCIEEKEPETKNTTEEIATAFITFLSQEKYANAYNYFNSTVKNQFSFSQFKGTWEYFTGTYGEFESIRDKIPSNESGFEIVMINCTFAEGYVITFRIVFDDLKEISGFWTDKIETINPYIAPEYVNLSSFTEFDITIGSGEWELPGTMSIPKGPGTFPCVVLVHGSGANDRDETIGPNKPFKDIAWGLASSGIVVLRYDKRTLVYPEETAKDMNLTVKEEVVDDAIEAVNLLKTFDEVDQNHIYVLGHSLGGMMAPQIAYFEENITGLIMLAAPARSLEDLIYDQTVYLSELDGVIDENETSVINMTEEALVKIKSLNISEDEQILTVYKAYWQYLNNYDQVGTADNLTIPVLLLQGKRDYQVTYEDDFIIWNNTFNDNTNVLLKTYDLLNHLFLSGQGKPTNTEYMIPGHVSEDVIQDIASFAKGEK